MSIVLQDLVKRHGGHTTVNHVSLEIADGELFVLLGPSGSGKSTILRMIAGLTPVSEGRIVLHGRDVTDLPPQQRDAGFVFQNYSLFKHMTVADNIEFGLTVRKVSRTERAARRDELLDIVGLAGLGHRYPAQLSGGQQQRVAVARALAGQPSVLLLDEPFGALDVKIRGQLRQSLKEAQRRLGVTAILVTHDQEEAFELADRIGVIDQGRLLEIGPSLDLYRRPQTEFVATFLGSANLLAGTLNEQTIRLGPVTLPAPEHLLLLDREGRVEVLFRPEDLLVAAEQADLAGPALGRGVVEAVTFLGTTHRMQVRLDPLPGTWSLPMRYGQEGALLDIASLSEDSHPADLNVGRNVWVGIKHYHVLPRIALRLLVVVDEAADPTPVLSMAAWFGERASASLNVLNLVADQARAEALTAQAREALGGVDPDVRIVRRAGVHAVEALRMVGGGDYDLVFVSGHGPASDGGVERLIRQSPTPVLIVKGERSALRRVLLCSAGGEPGKLDVMVGTRLARRAGAQATLLHVVDPDRHRIEAESIGAEPAERITRHLEAGRVTLIGQGVSVTATVRHGAPVDQILAESVEGDYDLIVVGGHLGADPPLRSQRDVAAQVVARADRSVLVVRGPIG